MIGMAPGGVRTDQHDEIGELEVVVAHRHHVFAERALVAGDGRRHAQPRVGVDVGRADVALHELVGDVVVLGQQLAGDVERHGLRPVLVDDAAERVARPWRWPRPRSRARRAPADAAAGPRDRPSRRARCPSRTACRDWPDARDRRARRRAVLARAWRARRSPRRSRDRWFEWAPVLNSLRPRPANRTAAGRGSARCRVPSAISSRSRDASRTSPNNTAPQILLPSSTMRL